MKKTAVWILILAMLLSLFAGCGTNVDEESESDTPELAKGWYEILDEDEETVGYLCSTGKKVSVLDEDGAELMEATRFSWDEDEEAFVIDDTPSFTLETTKKTVTMTVLKKSALPLDKGDYVLDEIDEEDVPQEPEEITELPDSSYALEDASGDVQLYLQVSDGEISLIGADGTPYEEDAEITYDAENQTFLIDGVEAFRLSKDGKSYALTVTGSSALPVAAGDYALSKVKESEIPEAPEDPYAGVWQGSYDLTPAIEQKFTEESTLADLSTIQEAVPDAELPDFSGIDLTLPVMMTIGEDGSVVLTCEKADMESLLDRLIEGLKSWIVDIMSEYVEVLCEGYGMSVEDLYAAVGAAYGTEVSSTEELLPALGLDLDELLSEIKENMSGIEDLVEKTGTLVDDGNEVCIVWDDGSDASHLSFIGDTLVLSATSNGAYFEIAFTK